MPDELYADTQMLELLATLKLDYYVAANIVLPGVDLKFAYVFVGILHFPEFLAFGWVEDHIYWGAASESQQRGDFILS